MTIYSLDVLLYWYEPVCISMSSSNCRFLTCIQIPQETGKVAWYSHLLDNFPQFVVIHTVRGFSIVNKAEVDIFLELSCFFHDPADVGNIYLLEWLKFKTLNWKYQVLANSWSTTGRSDPLLVSIQNSTAPSEYNLTVSYKTTHSLTVKSTYCMLRLSFNWAENIHPHKNLHVNV